MENKNSLSIFCWNIANPSIERAGQQAAWLRKRPEDIFVLTETKKSEGCLFLERYFQAYRYNVIFPKPENNEFGVMIVSKYPLEQNDFSKKIDLIPSRVVSTILDFQKVKLEIIGVYVPSRNAEHDKIEKKKRFLKALEKVLASSINPDLRIFCGDLNVLEPDHIPHYPFFEEWEYEFYQKLKNFQLKDAFRSLYPNDREYSWVGRTGDGYRYDHCFIANQLLPLLSKCYYYHEPRQVNPRLSDHSAIITEFDFLNR